MIDPKEPPEEPKEPVQVGFLEDNDPDEEQIEYTSDGYDE